MCGAKYSLVVQQRDIDITDQFPTPIRRLDYGICCYIGGGAIAGIGSAVSIIQHKILDAEMNRERAIKPLVSEAGGVARADTTLATVLKRAVETPAPLLFLGSECRGQWERTRFGDLSLSFSFFSESARILRARSPQ
ncbi:hypothetical protein DFP72DRAFT_855329 [Ephemerocybe angulata]|uniref:Uncharacterized protein n=1 Tax=Ephemerocybe angulata TaxID=980116 RepID=A0A8H6HHH2_9AGAR|nr:hypothetical protein DFP72DRAFT_855329 [Tulosesus angulatus]